MVDEQAQWLSLVTEEVIDPERPIVDPHHHLWDHERSRYLLDELLLDLNSGHNIISTVFVECSAMYRADSPALEAPVGETEFVNGVAAMSASGTYGKLRACAGIVGMADLTAGSAIGPVLDLHVRLSERFRGIRHAAGWDADEGVRNSHTNPPQSLFLRDDFREGFAELGKRDLSFDAWCYHHQLPELTSLAQAFPDTTIILDHFGGPLGIGPYAGKGDAIFEQWCIDAAELAKCDNVVAKIGGVLMPVNGFDLHSRDRPATSDEIVALSGRYHRKAIELFGPERCMFESNFPVDKASCSYPVLWNAFKKLGGEYSPDDQDRLFRTTAERVYRL